MATFTQHGLKLRFDISYSFALVTRLQKANAIIGADQIFKATEGLYNMPNILAVVVGLLITIAPRGTEYQLYVSYLVAFIIGYVLHLSNLYNLLPGHFAFCKHIGFYIYGYGIILILIIITSLILKGIFFAFFWLLAVLTKFLIFNVFEYLWTKYYLNKPGFNNPFSFPEISFFKAYKHYAIRNGVTTEISVSEEELLEENWKTCLVQYIEKHPRIARQIFK